MSGNNVNRLAPISFPINIQDYRKEIANPLGFRFDLDDSLSKRVHNKFTSTRGVPGSSSVLLEQTCPKYIFLCAHSIPALRRAETFLAALIGRYR